MFTFGPTNATISAVWQSNYFGIYRANKVINNVEPDSDVKNQCIAEAKFLRAYYLLEIVSMFGNGPVILVEPPPSEYAQPFAGAAAIYAQIEQDLADAIAGLPTKINMQPRTYSVHPKVLRRLYLEKHSFTRKNGVLQQPHLKV